MRYLSFLMSLSFICCAARPTLSQPADSIAVQSGSGQYGIKNETLPDSLIVAVYDSNDNVVSGETVLFVISSKPNGATGQTLSAASDVSDVNGEAGVKFTFGDKLGTYQVKAGIAGIDTVTFSFEALTLKATILKLQREIEKLVDENIKLIVAHESGITRSFTTISGETISFTALPDAALKTIIRRVLKENYQAISAKSLRMDAMIP